MMFDEQIEEYEFLRFFQDYSVTGNIDVLKFLYLLCLKNDIYVDDIFNICCSHGKFELVKWMYNKGIDDVDFAFNCACSKGHLEIAKWFSENVINIENDCKWI